MATSNILSNDANTVGISLPGNFGHPNSIPSFHTQQHIPNGMPSMSHMNFPPNFMNFLGAFQNFSSQSSLGQPPVTPIPSPPSINSSMMDISESSSSTAMDIFNNDELVDKLLDRILTNDRFKGAMLDIAKGAVAALSEASGDDESPKEPPLITFVTVKVRGEEPYDWKLPAERYKAMKRIKNPTTMLKAILEQLHPITEIRKMTLTGVNRRNEECIKLPDRTLDIVIASHMKYLWIDSDSIKHLPQHVVVKKKKKFVQDVRSLLTRNLHWYKTSYDAEGNKLPSTSKSTSDPTSRCQRKRASDAFGDDDDESSSDINGNRSPAKQTCKTSREIRQYDLDEDDPKDDEAKDDDVFDSYLDFNPPSSPQQSSSTSLLNGQTDYEPCENIHIFNAKDVLEETVNRSEIPGPTDCIAVAVPAEIKQVFKAKANAICKAFKQFDQAGPSGSVCGNDEGGESQPNNENPELPVDSSVDTPEFSHEYTLQGGANTKAKGGKAKKPSKVNISHTAGRAPSKRLCNRRSAAKGKGLAVASERYNGAGGLDDYEFTLGPLL